MTIIHTSTVLTVVLALIVSALFLSVSELYEPYIITVTCADSTVLAFTDALGQFHHCDNY